MDPLLADSIEIKASHPLLATSTIALTEDLTELSSSAAQPITKDVHGDHSISDTDLVNPEKSSNDQDPLNLSDSKPIGEEEWIRCAVHLAVIIDQAKDLIYTLTKDYKVHNRIEFLTNITTFCNDIKSLCGDLALKTKNVLNHELNNNDDKEDLLTKILDRNDQVSHDPGSRPATLNDNQRRYLINLGPYRPILSSYPKNEEMKQIRDTCCFHP